MPWYRIVPKTGNRKYLELPAGPINEHALANVKLISCWPTTMKPSKATPARYWQSCPVIFIKSSRAKKIDIYTTIKLIGDFFRVDPVFSIIESSKGTFIRFKDLLDFNPDCLSAITMKRVFEQILVDTVIYTFSDLIPVSVFLELNKNSNILSFYFNKIDFLHEINISEQDLNQYIDARRIYELNSNRYTYLNYLGISNQILLERNKHSGEVFQHIHTAILRCRYFKNIFKLSENSFYIDSEIVNFCFSLGPIGTSYLLEQIKKILDSILAQPLNDNMKALYLPIQLTLNKTWEVMFNPKLIKQQRCTPNKPACKIWCGALSPTELLGQKVEYLFPEKKNDKLGAAAEAFVHQLYGDRILFRRSELQKKFPKSMRCVYNIDLAISHLIAIGYISSTKAFINNFKPGKNAELFMIKWDNINLNFAKQKNFTSDMLVSPPPRFVETEKFYSE